MIKFFKELWAEIKKALFPEKPKLLSYSETRKELLSKPKSELINMVINLVSECEGTAPILDNRREMKQAYSKKRLVDGIMRLLVDNKKWGNEDGGHVIKQPSRKTKD